MGAAREGLIGSHIDSAIRELEAATIFLEELKRTARPGGREWLMVRALAELVGSLGQTLQALTVAVSPDATVQVLTRRPNGDPL